MLKKGMEIDMNYLNSSMANNINKTHYVIDNLINRSEEQNNLICLILDKIIELLIRFCSEEADKLRVQFCGKVMARKEVNTRQQGFMKLF